MLCKLFLGGHLRKMTLPVNGVVVELSCSKDAIHYHSSWAVAGHSPHAPSQQSMISSPRRRRSVGTVIAEHAYKEDIKERGSTSIM